MSSYPFKEIEARQQGAWQPASESAPPTVTSEHQAPGVLPATVGAAALPPTEQHKHFVLTLPAALEPGASSFTHLRKYILADVHARLQRLQGTAVCFSASWDGFGGELERYARESGKGPAALSQEGGAALKSLLKQAAITIDPASEVDLARPEWYGWAQWLFIQLFKRRLAFRKEPWARTAAAGDGLTDPPAPTGRRRGAWQLDLSTFGDRLLNDLDRTNWPMAEKKEQRYLIGRRRGCEVLFQVSHALRLEVSELTVFTTQVEAIYGATFILIHPEHPMLPAVLDPSYEDDVRRYQERLAKGMEPRISGARTGGFALNPANLKHIPVLVSALAKAPFLDGAVMGVPGHDPEQFELARRLSLPIREAIRGPGARYDVKGALREAYLGDGTLTNSSIFSGLPVRVARERIIGYLGRRGICTRITRYRLRDLPLSAPGRWGPPVPLIHCARCGEVPIPEEALPVVLPPAAGRALPAAAPPTRARVSNMRSPLSRAAEGASGPPEPPEPADLRDLRGFMATTCPICSDPAERDPHVLSPWILQALSHLFSAMGEEGRLAGRPSALEAAGLDLDSASSSPHSGTGPSSLPDGAAGAAAVAPAQGNFGVDTSGEGGLEAEDDAEPAAEEIAPPAEVFPEDRDLFPDLPPSEERPTRPGKSYRAEAPERATLEERPPTASEAAEQGGQKAEGSSAPVEAEEEEEEEEEEDEEAGQAPIVVESLYHPFRKESVARWLPADASFGGPEEGPLYLLRLRSITKFLNDIHEVEFPEPFYRYLRVGPLEVRDGASPGAEGGAERREKAGPAGPPAVLAPRAAIERYGSDAVRLAILGASAPQCQAVISTSQLEGAKRFLDRIWRQVTLRIEKGKFVSRPVLEAKHRLILHATQRLRRFKFHTALAALHEFVNFLSGTTAEEMERGSLRTFLTVLWPFAPHLADELWGRLGETGSIRAASWPEANKEILRTPEREVPVRIEGRLCARIKVASGLEREKLEAQVLKDERVLAALAGRPVTRVIAVPDRVVNLVLEGPLPAAGAPPPGAGAPAPQHLPKTHGSADPAPPAAAG